MEAYALGSVVAGDRTHAPLVCRYVRPFGPILTVDLYVYARGQREVSVLVELDVIQQCVVSVVGAGLAYAVHIRIGIFFELVLVLNCGEVVRQFQGAHRGVSADQFDLEGVARPRIQGADSGLPGGVGASGHVPSRFGFRCGQGRRGGGLGGGLCCLGVAMFNRSAQGEKTGQYGARQQDCTAYSSFVHVGVPQRPFLSLTPR